MVSRDLLPWRFGRRSSENNPLMSFQREFDRMFDDFFRGFNLVPSEGTREIERAISPRVDVAETKNGYELTAELPGVQEKDLTVSVRQGVLTLKGEKKFEKEEKDKSYHRVERSYGMFERDIDLGEDIDDSKIAASFNNGVLKIEVPRKPGAQPTVKKIEVKTTKAA